MTTTQSLYNSSLSVDVEHDRMEMATSPYNAPDDQDVDFELDETEQFIEDNSMVDDAIEENMDTTYNQDDIMFDEDNDELLDFDQDLSMDPEDASFTDDPQMIQESATENANETLLHDEKSVDPHVDEIALQTEHPYEIEDENTKHTEQNTQEEDTNLGLNTSTNEHTTKTEGSSVDTEGIAPNLPLESSAAAEPLPEEPSTSVVDFADTSALNHKAEEPPPQQVENQHPTDYSEAPTQVSGSLPTEERETQAIEALANQLEEETQAQTEIAQSVDVKYSPEREGSPENLHSVTIRFNGEDCWLFPPLETNDVRHIFLQDATLASQPFDQMLTALRPALIENQDMAEHDEIVFDIPALGLHICEDSKYASAITLSRVIDMYMMLSQNEGLTVFEPLQCELSTRVCLNDQFAYLDDAAFSRRMTYSEFVAEQLGTPDEATNLEETVAEQIQSAEEELQTGEHVLEEVGEEVTEQTNTTKLADSAEQQDAGVEHHQSPDEDEHEDQAEGTNGASTDIYLEPTENPEPVIEDEENHDEPRASSSPRQASSSTSTKSMSQNLVALPETANNAENILPESDEKTYNHSHAYEENEIEATGDTIAQSGAELELSVDAIGEGDDEDLFADDDDDNTELEAHQTDDKETKDLEEQADQTTQNLDIENDEFDFDNWSDDEPTGSKIDDSTKIVTPSKSLNGKRKLLEEDDDFLEIDVSTPEPKRSRPS